MKEEFAGYYRPNETEFAELWRNCVFVLDTSVLLNLYRFPQEARDDLLEILGAVSDRLWLPYQVALEYQENRLQVVAEQVSKYREVRTVLETSQRKLESELQKLQLKKRHSRIQPDGFLEGLGTLIDEFLGELEEFEHEQPGVFDEDQIRQALDALLEGKVGPPPESQEALDALYEEGDARYENKRPPGYLDADKEHEFLYGGLQYQTKFGDWILWHQILAEANGKELEHVIFVTDDDKEDWWWLVNSQGKKTIGPRPELVAEMYAKSSVSLFYMYNSRGFMQFAADYLDIDIDEESLRQVRDIIELHGFGLYRYDDTAFNEFLQTLIDLGQVEGETRAMTERVITAGIDSLDDRQINLFKEDVLDQFVEMCSRCGNEIPWSEMAHAWESDWPGPLCSYCMHMWEKIKKE